MHDHIHYGFLLHIKCTEVIVATIFACVDLLSWYKIQPYVAVQKAGETSIRQLIPCSLVVYLINYAWCQPSQHVSACVHFDQQSCIFSEIFSSCSSQLHLEKRKRVKKARIIWCRYSIWSSSVSRQKLEWTSSKGALFCCQEMLFSLYTFYIICLM